MFKMPWKTKHFNKNQKVWVSETTGNMASKVVGKFRGSGRYVTVWVSWENRQSLPIFKGIPVALSFCSRHKLYEYGKQKEGTVIRDRLQEDPDCPKRCTGKCDQDR